MKIYGYARVSTLKQSLKRQLENIKKLYPEAVILTDEFTGTKMERPTWTKLYKSAKAGDVIVFDEVSRMSRDAVEGFKVYKELFDRGVTLVFIKEPHINTDTYKAAIEKQINAVKTGDAATDELTEGIMSALNRYMMRLAERQIKLAFEQAQKEADFLHERTKEGIREVKQRNERILMGVEQGEVKQIGNAKGAKLTTKKSIAAKVRIKELSKDFDGTLDDGDVMKLTGLARNTYYKYKRELKEAQAK